ncbi:ribosome-associated translation inhibitor RaiA [candidate division TA06 bacterium]|uniref:Ribosome-associated translation inhibitor RaiA n=1 Tax=candidate division TA06 bacterium TaxID=2250710 RepID=A0A523UMK5_UNCT6|nr:MAG: ribosome-associated translation inhibitor RaiA [candidate division TA06 bacterium]
MDVDVTVRHGILVNGEVRRMLEAKVEKLARFSRHLVSTHVIVEKDGRGLLLELNVTARRKVFSAKSKGFDLVDVIEDAVDKMSRQLRRYEERNRDKKKEAGTGRYDDKGEEHKDSLDSFGQGE